jgi:uncharacterized protein (DUF1778 family)
VSQRKASKTPKKRMGRPPKAPEERKAAALTLRWTQAERDAAETAAEKSGLALSDWIRKVVAAATDS